MPRAIFLVGDLSPGLSCTKEHETDSERRCFKVEQNWKTPCFPFLSPSDYCKPLQMF